MNKTFPAPTEDRDPWKHRSEGMRCKSCMWLASLEAADAQRKGAQPLTSKAPVQQTSPSLSQELLATGFGPECHDEEDPTANTRVII